MQQFILKENVLTDNVLLLAEEGKVFKGNYIAIIREYSYATSWSDREKITRFRNEGALNKYLSKHYPEFTYEVY
jgi:hypothetical protein